MFIPVTHDHTKDKTLVPSTPRFFYNSHSNQTQYKPRYQHFSQFQYIFFEITLSRLRLNDYLY